MVYRKTFNLYVLSDFQLNQVIEMSWRIKILIIHMCLNFKHQPLIKDKTDEYW